MPLVILCAILLIFPRSASAVTIDTALVGNPGNPNDPADGDDGALGIQNFGAVSYAYRIGITEVTNAQYVDFLNSKAASDPLGLYNARMGTDARGGITQGGVSGGFTYAVKTNMGSKPVNFVSWYDSIRFANWLNNGQGTGSTETGAYTILGGTRTPSNGNDITRNVGAKWFLPSENEWYKAAYYQPAAQGGDVDNYWLYPTRSNSAPTMATANSVGDISNPGTNVTNYLYLVDWNGTNGNVTTVGSAGPLSKSYYGTSDQGGNVFERNEELLHGAYRGVRGGSFDFNEVTLQSYFRFDFLSPSSEDMYYGFRVATVPEPSTCALAALGALGLLIAARRRL